MLYELKTYTPHAGKEDALRQRFLQKTLPLFAKHGIHVCAVMAPAEAPHTLCYLTQFDSEAAKAAAWVGFMADPEWAQVKQRTEADGPLLASQHTAVFRGLDGPPASPAQG